MGWSVGSAGLAVGQAIRILRFRRRLLAAIPAPDLLVYELERISERLGVRAPRGFRTSCLGDAHALVSGTASTLTTGSTGQNSLAGPMARDLDP